jgi:putative membrane protein
MRHSYTTWLTLGASAIAFSAAAQNRQLPPPSTATPVSPQTQVAHGEEAEFLLDALRSSKAEMQMGELAQQRSKNVAVQQFGQKLRADHAKAADDIENLLEPLNMSVPAEPSTEQQSHHAALAKLSGEEFDRAFVPLMVASHREAIAKYEAQTHANPNQQVSDLATKQLPALREHLATAESLQK